MKRYVFVGIVLACIVTILLVRQRSADETFKGVTLRFSFWGGPSEVKAIEAVCRRFEALHPGVHIKTEHLPWGPYWDKLKTLAAGRADKPTDGLPDVIRLSSTDAAQWYPRDQLVDLTPYVRRDKVDFSRFYDASAAAVTWEGKIGSMPTDSAVRVYIYDKDLFDAAGVPYPDAKTPMTWDELRAVARKLTVRVDGKVTQYGLSLGYMEYQAFIAQAGGTVVDVAVNPKRVTVNTPEGVRALKFYADLVLVDGVSPTVSQHQKLGFGAPDFALASGKVAIQHGGTWSIPDLLDEKKVGRKVRLGLAPIARETHRSQVAFTNSCGISAKSRHPEEAWAFLKFFASVEGQRLVARGGIGIPALKEVARSDAFLKGPFGVENMSVFLDELEHAETNVMATTGEFRDTMNKIVSEQLCLGTVDAAAAAERMTERGNTLLSAERPEPTTLTGVIVPAIVIALLLALLARLLVRVRRRVAGELHRPSRRENAAGYLFILPWLVGVACFALGPILLALATSFTDWNLFEDPRYVGAENYAKILLADREFWQSVKVTMLYAVTSIPIQLVGGLVCAVLLNARGVRFTGVFRTVLYLPYLFTGVAISIAWRWMYADNGVINHLLERVGIAGPDWLMSETWALPAIVLMNFTWLGGNMIIFLAALQGVPQSLYDAAQVDGAGPFRRFRHVTLPMISPAVLFNLIMGTIWSFQVFAVPRIMTDGGPNDATLFYVLNLYRRAFQYNQMGYACALAVILFVIIFAVALVELRGSRRWVHYEGAA